MADIPYSAPDQTAAANDPGDETARRYRYQWTWAAIVSCMLFDDTQDVEEVFCEHHEDVLIKHRDGTFSGHQVKTRASDQPVWKAGDESVRGACARFAILEAKFPGKFREFHFLTNHPLHAAKNAQCLRYVLEQIAAISAPSALPSNVSAWLRRIAHDAGCSEDIAFRAIVKTVASDDLPKLQDSSMRLIDTLTGCWSRASECSHETVKHAAQMLVDECGRASSLDHLNTLPAYLPAAQSPEAELAARVNGKRMTPDRVAEILDQSLNNVAMLVGDPESLVEPGTGSTSLMFKKLDAGGFSAVSRNSAEDLRNKADYLGIVWTKKHGKTKGLERYDHIRSLVLSDAARAFDETQTVEQKFGPRMRNDLSRRFQERREQGEELFDCTREHLEGIAYSLTAQCHVQWSTDRPWEEED